MAQAYFSNTGSFFVQDRSGNYYPATFLTYSDGTPVVDSVLANGISPYTATRPQLLNLYADTAGTIYNPNGLANPGNGNPNNYLVVPSGDYMNILASRGEMYGNLARSADATTQAGGDASVLTAEATTILNGTFAPKVGFGDAQYQGIVGPTMDTLYWGASGVSQAVGGGPIDSADHFIPAFTNAGNYG